MPPRSPSASRYVVEIRDAAGTSLLLTSANRTGKERDLAMSTILRLVGMKAAAPPKPKQRSGEEAPIKRRKPL